MLKSELSPKRRFYAGFMTALMWLSIFITAAILIAIVVYVLVKGLPHVTWNLLSTAPSYLEENIGILPNILNTLYIIIATLFFVLPLGVGAAVYLNEYASNKRIVSIIEYAAETLFRHTSIIYGLSECFFLWIWGLQTQFWREPSPCYHESSDDNEDHAGKS